MLKLKFKDNLFGNESKLHEDNFAPRVKFAWVTILHGGSFLHEGKKKQKYNLKKNRIKTKR